MHRSAPNITLLAMVLAALSAMPCARALTPPEAGHVSHPAPAPSSDDQAKADLAAAPIHSRADLDAYIAHTPAEKSPLTALSPEGRKRFLESLHFGDKGLGGFGTAELGRELSRQQIYNILSLFGAQAFTDAAADTGNPGDSRRRATPTANSAVARAALDIQAVGRNEELSDAVMAKRKKGIYLTKIAPSARGASLARLTSDDLHDIIASAFDVTLFTADATIARDARHALELVKRGDAYGEDFRNTVQALVTVRDIPAARNAAVAGHMPTDNLLDIRVHAAAGHRLMTEDEATHVLDARPFTIPQHGVYMLVVSSPACHFTRDAAKGIDANDTLRRAMANGSTWIVPPGGSLLVPELKDWNTRHPGERMSSMYAQADWPDLDSLATPTFYVFRDGKLAKRIVGWEGDATIGALLGAFGEAPTGPGRPSS